MGVGGRERERERERRREGEKERGREREGGREAAVVTSYLFQSVGCVHIPFSRS